MPDLTDADLEAMEKRRVRASNELYNVNHLRGNASTALEEDIPALIAALREARGERDTMSELYAREGHKSLVLLNENTSLLAENRLLRDVVAEYMLSLKEWSNEYWESRLDVAPLTAAEVARVQRLEAESEAARAFRNEYRKDFGAWKDLRDDLFQLLDEHDEAAALAELDAGEGPC